VNSFSLPKREKVRMREPWFLNSIYFSETGDFSKIE
jgi:hypothetical protein